MRGVLVAILCLILLIPLASAATQWHSATGTSSTSSNLIAQNVNPSGSFATGNTACSSGPTVNGAHFTSIVTLTTGTEYFVVLDLSGVDASPQDDNLVDVYAFSTASPTVIGDETALLTIHGDGTFTNNAGTFNAKWITDNNDDFGAPHHRITASVWVNDTTSHFIGFIQHFANSKIGLHPTLNSTSGLFTYSQCTGNDIPIFTSAPTPPTTPTLSLAMAARAINLTWGAQANATVYNVWRDTRTHDITCAVMGSCTMNSTGFPYYGNTANLWWSTVGDAAINNNTNYTYVIDAANAAGESAPSNIANWTYNVPNATATTGPGTVALSWNAVNGADHYNVYQALVASADFTPMNATAYTYVNTTNASPYTVTGLLGGTTYHFRVQALNTSSAEGWASPDVNATPTTGGTPSAPVLTYTLPDGNHALLSWTTPAIVGDGLQGYNITRTGDCGAVTHLGLQNTLLVGLCTQNATLTVHAWNDAGNGNESNAIVLRLGAQSLAGTNGAFYDGNLTSYAAQIGTTPAAVQLAYGFLITLLGAGAIGTAVAMLGGTFSKGAIAGSVAGFAISIALGMIPVWVILLFAAASGLAIAVKLTIARRNGGS